MWPRPIPLAWELGCKGITVYVTGSREKVVLETQATVSKKSDAAVINPETGAAAPAAEQPVLWQWTKKPRPRYLVGYTFSVETPLGKAFITINENGGQPALRGLHQHRQGRLGYRRGQRGHRPPGQLRAAHFLAGGTLRAHPGGDPPAATASAAGARLGFGPKRVRSLPDGVSQVLSEYIQQRAERLLKEQPVALKETHR